MVALKKVSLINKGNSMARITSEKAAAAVGNRFDLVLIAAQRVRELKNGSRPLIATKNGAVITALKEIEEGKVGREYLLKLQKKPRRSK
jgi:DNA-directed RNA polymerase subunit omega